MNTALLVIDVQQEYVDGTMPIQFPPLNGSLERIGAAMDVAAGASMAIAVIQHCSAEPDAQEFVEGSHGWQLHRVVTDRHYETVIHKHLPGSFTGTTLQDWLTEHAVDHVVLCGYLTHMCVDTTARQAFHRGLSVTVLHDATGTIDLSPDLPASAVHTTEIAVLGSAFADISTVAAWAESLNS